MSIGSVRAALPALTFRPCGPGAAAAALLTMATACSGAPSLSPSGDAATSAATDGPSAIDGVAAIPDAAAAAVLDGDAAASSTADDAAALSSPPVGPALVSATTGGPSDSHTSPAIVAGPGQGVVAVFDDTDEDLAVHAVGWARSTNEGASFTDEGHFPDPTSGGVRDNFGTAAIARDARAGAVYVAALGSTPESSNAIAFFASYDDGVTFNPAINAADPTLAATDFIDFPAIAVDGTAGYSEGTVYVAYADFVDGGSQAVKLRLSTFTQGAFAVTEVVSPALGSGDEASLPSVAVLPNHDVLIAFYRRIGGAADVAVVKSSDQGQHFEAPVSVAPLHTPSPTVNLDGDLGLLGVGPDGGAAPMTVYPSPVLATNPSSSALYIAFVDATEDDKANVYFVGSADEGQSWSAPVQVNDDATTADQFLPALAVSPDGAHLAVDFYDRRDDAANLAANRYGATAAVLDAGVAFGPNFRLSPQPFSVQVGGDPYLAPTYFATHTSMATDGTYFFDAYTDTTDGHLDVELVRYGIDY